MRLCSPHVPARALMQTRARLTLEPLLLFHRSHTGRTHAHGVCAAEKTELESRKVFERERCPRFAPGATCRLAARQLGTTSLTLRDLPLKERSSVVDTASIPTPTPLRNPIRNPIRARDEKCLPYSPCALEKNLLPAGARWVLTEKILEL